MFVTSGWTATVNLGVDLSLSLQQKLSFQMIQSLKLLQETTLQLEQRIHQELAVNPLLEIDEDIHPEELADEVGGSLDEDGELHVSEDEIDVDEYLEDGFEYAFDTGGGKNSEDDQERREYVESLQVYEESMEEALLSQITELALDPQQRLLVEFLAGSLDERGYLNIPLEEIGLALHLDLDVVETGVDILQSLEPAGIGAQDLRECLMIQLERSHRMFTYAYQILEDHWGLFEKLKVPAIAKAMGEPMAVIQEAIDDIRQLDPKPGRQFNQSSAGVIIPDLIVEEVKGEYIVVINDSFLPNVRVNEAYSEMLKKRGGMKKDMKQFLRDKLNSATWLMRAVEQRRSTMLRVMQAILDRQEIFFRKGPPNLAPLKLQEIADAVDMHISTISRVTSNKYVQTPYGLFELKYFFSEALGKDESGEDISTTKIKNRLRELIEGEDNRKPLSDQKLSELLQENGFAVARRTVAKYREQLGLATARMRKSYE